MRRLLVIALVLVGVTAVGIGGLYAWVEAAANAPVKAEDTTPVQVEIPKGASLTRVGHVLQRSGLINDVNVWRLYVKLHGSGPGVKAGRHALNKGMNVPRLLDALSKNPLSEDVPLTMVEGWRLRDADAWLSANGWIEAGAYLEATKDPTKYTIPFEIEGATLEGYLLPETYAVPKGPLDVPKLVQRQIDGFSARFAKPFADEIAKSGRTLHDIVVMASMLEREEPKPAVRPNVAGILFKRLDHKNPLGVDATSRYLLDDWSDRRKFLAKLRDPDDPYNTRLKAGLPPTAIGAPSIDSLLGALRPVASEYWYYLHDAQQNIRYARDGAGHEANRKKYNVY